MDIESRLKEKGIILPKASNPAANYINCVRVGNLLFVSGKAPLGEAGQPAPKGKLGREFSTKEGYAFARKTGLDILSVVELELGSLNKVQRVVKVQAFVNATEDFEEHPQVLNGCSDLLVEVFGEQGVHARSVAGVNSLRGGVPIVIEAIFQVEG
jgi:enamine deaminase RidA (YjgF/YER057c/UK114 family)